MAYLLFINKPDVETIDHDEVRRLRKSLQLLADTQTDYVVEIDRAGVMTFVSPSFCRAVGAQESELVGREFLTRVCEDDRPAAAAALAEAGKPPFIGKMRARLAADPRVELEWQIDAVIGDGIVGLDLVGRIAGENGPPLPRRSPGGIRRQRRRPRPRRRRACRSPRRSPPKILGSPPSVSIWRRSSRAISRASWLWRAPSPKRPAPSASSTTCSAAMRSSRRWAGASRRPPDAPPAADATRSPLPNLPPVHRATDPAACPRAAA